MTENLSKVPKRGILKASTSFEQRENDPSSHVIKNPHFDEMNIIATLHPANKDYGFMKVDEPKTPFEYLSDGEEEDDEGAGSFNDQSTSRSEQSCTKFRGSNNLNANLLAEKIASEGHKGPRPRKISEQSFEEEEEEEDKYMSPEDRERRKSFEQKRKAHYNEFQTMKARQLMREKVEDDDDDDDDDDIDEDQSLKEGTSTSSNVDDDENSAMDTTTPANTS